MNKTTLLLIASIFVVQITYGNEPAINTDTIPVQKGSYKLLKFDALNLMGLGIQKLHIGFEISPMRESASNLPTLQFNLTSPFNSLNECTNINYGLEGGAELRFYQRRRRKTNLVAEGMYIGVGLDGGYTNFNRLDKYFSNIGNGNKEVDTEYKRIRTGIFFLTGAQTKLGDKLYFDANIGLGWSNVSVTTDDNTVDDPNWSKSFDNCGVLYVLYEDGKYQQLYMPVSFSIGYNFGTK